MLEHFKRFLTTVEGTEGINLIMRNPSPLSQNKVYVLVLPFQKGFQ